MKKTSTIWRAVALAAILAAMPSAGLRADTLQEAIARLTPEQQAKLKAYEKARAAYERQVDHYWRQTELKRTRRRLKQMRGKPITAADYVKEQPPVYKGPQRPKEIMALLPKPPPQPVEPKAPIPVVADFLREAETNYNFVPDQVSDDDFMIAYAIEALNLGLTRDQVVRVYALETGGVGSFNLQSGYNPKTGHAASTALGYAQLLAANSIEQIRKEGPNFVARLEDIAASGRVSSEKAESLRQKAECLRRMIADASRVPESWPSHVAYAKSGKGLGMHALNLDGDIGPWMQVVKLKSIKDYAAKKGFSNLSGAQLEIMNLAGPARGFEMMQGIGSTMPTSNFFDRGGYERNPVVHDKTGTQLLAKLNEIMDRNVQKPGAARFAQIFEAIERRMHRQKDALSQAQ